MAALEPRRLGAAAGVGAATKASEAAFSRARPPGSHTTVLRTVSSLETTHESMSLDGHNHVVADSTQRTASCPGGFGVLHDQTKHDSPAAAPANTRLEDLCVIVEQSSKARGKKAKMQEPKATNIGHHE